MSDSPTGPTPAVAFSRRTLLMAAVAATAVMTAGCTGEGDASDAVTPAQVDQLAAQVDVQAALVTAYDRAFAADPNLAAGAAVLADQARQQLDRLRAAAPGASSSAGASPSGSPSASPGLDPEDARPYLRREVAAAADAHAQACPAFSGARAALLGSIAAGLRGQDGQLA
jgi:hypothetical protein